MTMVMMMMSEGLTSLTSKMKCLSARLDWVRWCLITAYHLLVARSSSPCSPAWRHDASSLLTRLPLQDEALKWPHIMSGRTGGPVDGHGAARPHTPA